MVSDQAVHAHASQATQCERAAESTGACRHL
jgi:hypothetical protein